MTAAHLLPAERQREAEAAVAEPVPLIRGLNEAPVGLFHLKAVITAGVGFFADAYDLFIIGPALVLIKGLWHPSSASVAFLSASSLLAAFFGALIFGRLADVVGRKRIYGFEAVLMVIGSLGCAFAPNIAWLIAARVVLGVGIGGDYPVSAVLIAEYANRSDRGRLVGMVFSMQAAGLVAGPVVALTLLAAGVDHELLWRILLGVGALPAAMVIYRRRRMPESPRFMAKIEGRGRQAARDLASFSRGGVSAFQLDRAPSKLLSLRAFLTDRRYLLTLLGTAGTWFLLDYAYYGNTISAPLILHTVDHHASLTSTLAWTLIIFLAAAVPGYVVGVLLIDRIGHRRLQIGGFMAMGAAFAAIGAIPGVASAGGAFLIVYGLSYFFTECGPNMTTFVLAAELYPVEMRTTGDGISAGVGKLGAFTGVFVFPAMTVALGLRGTLLVSAGFCVAGGALSLVLPEPARRSLEEVSAEPPEPDQAMEPFMLLRRERANRERAEALARSASVFAASLEGDRVLAELAVQARAGLRCGQAVVLLSEDARIVSIHTEGITEPALSEILDVVGGHVPGSGAGPDDWAVLLGLADAKAVAVDRVTLRTQGEVIVVCADSQRRQFGADERSLLRAVCGQAGIALDNALLYEHSRRSEAQYRQLVEQLPPVLYSRRADALVPTYVSPRVQQLLGVSEQEFLSDPWSRVHPDDQGQVLRLHSQPFSAGERIAEEYRMLRADGQVIWVSDEAMLLPGPPRVVQGLLSDITARRAAEAEVEFLASHDPLTRLANRRMFDEVLELALARSRRHPLSVGVLYIDLDHFKPVNDTFGHDAGDRLLIEVAKRLTAATRDQDVVVRHGGDEFLVLIDGLPEHTDEPPGSDTPAPLAMAEAAAQRIVEALKEPIDLAGTTHTPSASIGVAVFPLHAEDASSLVQAADAAMYLAKRQGKGRIACYSDAAATSTHTPAQQTRLRDAVKNKEWALHYQPVVDLASGEVLAVEALVRWCQDNGQLIGPGEFLPLAEELGLMREIEEWVFTEACRQAAQWRAQGLTLPVGVNLSPQQLDQPRLATRLAAVADSYALPAGQMTIEITETKVIQAPELAVPSLQELRGKGFSIAIDDFGTGYSSLSRLQHMPVDTLKIDRSFIQLLPHDPRAQQMVRSQIDLAHSLGLTCVAEGVETEDQRSFLLEAGCRRAQGYLFARPLPPEEIPATAANLVH